MRPVEGLKILKAAQNGVMTSNFDMCKLRERGQTGGADGGIQITSVGRRSSYFCIFR
jgi:hypothetical protein